MKTTSQLLLAGIVVVASGCASIGSGTGDNSTSSVKSVKQVVHSVEESQAQYMLGKYYLGQGRVGLSLAAFNRAIQHDPANAEARNARGITLVRIGDLKGAIRELETAVASNPDTPHLLNNLAYAQMLNGSLILAAESLRKALTIDPKNAKARENWRQLSSRATSNPALAKQLIDSIPAAPAAETKPITQAPAPAPRSAGQPVRHAQSVINIDFGKGVTTAAPLVAYADLPPLAVDIRAVSERSTLANTFAAVVGASVVPFAVAEAVSPHPSKTTILTSLVPAESRALPPVAVVKKKRVTRARTRIAREAGPHSPGYNLSKVMVEVSNGNGVKNLAKVLSRELRRHKLRVWSISNARNFRFATTRIYYAQGHRNEAVAISRMLPVQAEVMPAPQRLRHTEIRIVIGKDFGTHEMARDLSPVAVRSNAA